MVAVASIILQHGFPMSYFQRISGVLLSGNTNFRRGEEYIEDLQHGGFSGGAVSDIPWESGIVNGKGRYDPIANASLPLEVITVHRNKRYRLRTINACSSFGVRFSIDDHELEILQTTADYVNPQVVGLPTVHAF